MAGTVLIQIGGLSEAALVARNRACADYPLGIDLFLVDSSGRLLGIPRTTLINREVN